MGRFRYQDRKSPSVLVLEFFNLVGEINMQLSDCEKELRHVYCHAHRIYSGLNREIRIHVDLQDLIQAGKVGLWDATNKYKVDSAASFTSYANIRIRGEMIVLSFN